MLFNIGNFKLSLCNIINLHTAAWLQLTNNNNSQEMIEQYYLINRWDPNKYYNAG